MDLSGFIEGDDKYIHIEGNLEVIHDAIIDAVVKICMTKTDRTIFIYGRNPSMMYDIAREVMEPPPHRDLVAFSTPTNVTVRMKEPRGDSCRGDSADSMIFLNYLTTDDPFYMYFIMPIFGYKRSLICIKHGGYTGDRDLKPVCNVAFDHIDWNLPGR
jgi:hypothetical protein